MYSSRAVFARMDAAAMDKNFPSPLMIQVCGMPGYGLNLFPSINNDSGLSAKLSMARCIAKKLAFNMFILSISLGQTNAMWCASDFSRISSRSNRLVFSESFFESLS